MEAAATEDPLMNERAVATLNVVHMAYLVSLSIPHERQ